MLGGGLEFHGGAGTVASGRCLVQKRVSVRAKESGQSIDFRSVLPVVAGCLAWSETAFHFAPDTTGMLGRRLQVLRATTDKEQVEERLLELFGCPARAERAKEQCLAARQPMRQAGAGEAVLKEDLDE